jgi:hypothetical protein
MAEFVWSAWVSVKACPASLRMTSGSAHFRGIIRSQSPWMERTGQGTLSTPVHPMIMRPTALICAVGWLTAISMRHVSASRVRGAKRQWTKGRHERRPSTKSGMKGPSLSTHRYDDGRRPGRKQLPRRINPATGRCRAISPASMPPNETPPTISAGWMFRPSALREAY